MSYERITSFRAADDFAAFLERENYAIPFLADLSGQLKLAEKVPYRSGVIGNRWAILPMEGWDCQPDGCPSALTRRRWLNFARSGAKLIFGTEACAVMHEAKSNTRQLTMNEKSADAMARLLNEMRLAHAEKFGTAETVFGVPRGTGALWAAVFTDGRELFASAGTKDGAVMKRAAAE